VLKNTAIVDEAEKLLKDFKPVTYDVNAHVKAIETFESKAVSEPFGFEGHTWRGLETAACCGVSNKAEWVRYGRAFMLTLLDSRLLVQRRLRRRLMSS
jgi:hypothetical protein